MTPEEYSKQVFESLAQGTPELRRLLMKLDWDVKLQLHAVLRSRAREVAAVLNSLGHDLSETDHAGEDCQVAVGDVHFCDLRSESSGLRLDCCPTICAGFRTTADADASIEERLRWEKECDTEQLPQVTSKVAEWDGSVFPARLSCVNSRRYSRDVFVRCESDPPRLRKLLWLFDHDVQAALHGGLLERMHEITAALNSCGHTLIQSDDVVPGDIALYDGDFDAYELRLHCDTTISSGFGSTSDADISYEEQDCWELEAAEHDAAADGGSRRS